MADGPQQPLAEAKNVRDHLANERTFLAWIRSGVALLGFGVLIAKLRFLGIAPEAGVRSGRLGLAFALAGLVTLGLATWQYARTRRMIDGGDYCAPTLLIHGFGALVFALGLASVFYLLVLLK